MARTTAAAVAALAEDGSIDAAVVPPFLETANRLVTKLLATKDLLDDTDLELIERWLAAHFYKSAIMEASSETVEGVSEAKQYRLGLVLLSTMWGQQACILDITGTLAAYSKAVEQGKAGRVKATWLGKEPTE